MKELTIDENYKPQVGDVTQHGWTCIRIEGQDFIFQSDGTNREKDVHSCQLWLWHGLTVYREEEVTGIPLLTITLLDDEELFSVGGLRHLYDALVEAGAQKGDTLHFIKAEGE